jgi:hypothetical protein
VTDVWSQRADAFRESPTHRESWLERVDTPPDTAARIRELLADRIDDGMLAFDSILLKAPRSQK